MEQRCRVVEKRDRDVVDQHGGDRDIFQRVERKPLFLRFLDEDCFIVHVRFCAPEIFFDVSRAMQSLETQSKEVAGFDCNVIIQGEKGVGKERVLEMIHENSSRRGNPCIKVNCGSVNSDLLEEEIFGTAGKKGAFELADNGIIFLDEIGKLDYDLQGKILSVLQTGKIIPAGGKDLQDINVRVICSGTTPLHQLVKEGKFRADLYYQISIYTIEIPPLRERQDDIYRLSKMFLKEYCIRYSVDKDIENDAMAVLVSYDWPGNIRELENLIQRFSHTDYHVYFNGYLVDGQVVMIHEKDGFLTSVNGIVRNVDTKTDATGLSDEKAIASAMSVLKC